MGIVPFVSVEADVRQFMHMRAFLLFQILGNDYWASLKTWLDF